MSGWGKKNAYINNTFVEHVTPNLHDDAWCKLGCYIYFTPLFISGFVDIENGEHRYHGYPDRSLGEVFPHTYPGGDVNTVVSNKLDPPPPSTKTELLLSDVIGQGAICSDESFGHEFHRVGIFLFVVRHRPEAMGDLSTHSQWRATYHMLARTIVSVNTCVRETGPRM